MVKHELKYVKALTYKHLLDHTYLQHTKYHTYDGIWLEYKKKIFN